MKQFYESEIKYLAGLLDADGSLSFKFCKTETGKTYLYLVLSLTASKKIDKHGYLYSLGERLGSCCEIKYKKPNHNDAVKWHVQSRRDLNLLIPRLTKHMVIKARHWDNLHNIFTEYKGVDVTGKEEELKELSSLSRKNTGPLKPKKHPTWAWVAGYMDGDGCYTLSKRCVHIGAIAHTDDAVALELLYHAFGGSLYEPRLEDNTRLWRKGAGIKNADFAKHFLNKVHRHSRLKKWKIEQMIAFHNQPQRLSDYTSTEEAIV